MKTKYFLSIFLIISLSLSGSFCLDTGSNNSDEDLTPILGLAALAQRNQSAPLISGSLGFEAKLDNKSLECGDTEYTLPGGQKVQIRDFRFFVEDVTFINDNGFREKMEFSEVDEYQIREGNDQVAMLDFSEVGKGKCSGTSDNPTKHTAIQGRFANKTYKSVEITVGVPQALNHRDPAAQVASSPLRAATGLTWNWLAGYKFARIEWEMATSTSSTNRLVLHLGSTNCTDQGDNTPNNPNGNVTCANPYRAVYTLSPEGGFNPTRDGIRIQADELFRGNPANGQTVGVPVSSFSSDTGKSLSCMPIGNGSGAGGTPETCGPILRNLGILPGTSGGFMTGTNSETGVGTVDTSFQQPVFSTYRK